MGKLFNKPKSIEDGLVETVKETSNELKNIPEDVENFKYLSKIGSGSEMLFYHTLKTIVQLGDMEDFKDLNSAIAKNFFEDIFENDKTLMQYLKESDLEFLVSYMNKILLNYSLGYIQLSISETNKEHFEIYLYDSFFVKFAKRENKISKEKINEESICFFYESLFSTLFSSIFEQTVIVEEKLCSIVEENSKCVFNVKIG